MIDIAAPKFLDTSLIEVGDKKPDTGTNIQTKKNESDSGLKVRHGSTQEKKSDRHEVKESDTGTKS